MAEYGYMVDWSEAFTKRADRRIVVSDGHLWVHVDLLYSIFPKAFELMIAEPTLLLTDAVPQLTRAMLDKLLRVAYRPGSVTADLDAICHGTMAETFPVWMAADFMGLHLQFPYNFSGDEVKTPYTSIHDPLLNAHMAMIPTWQACLALHSGNDDEEDGESGEYENILERIFASDNDEVVHALVEHCNVQWMRNKVNELAPHVQTLRNSMPHCSRTCVSDVAIERAKDGSFMFEHGSWRMRSVWGGLDLCRSVHLNLDLKAECHRMRFQSMK